MSPEPESLRLDKWLWQARFFKSRSLATTICLAGSIRVDGAAVAKAHFLVRPGHVLTFIQGRQVRVVRVLQLGARRGPAAEAQALYEDLSPPQPEALLPRSDPGRRPTKQERRAWRRMTGEEE